MIIFLLISIFVFNGLYMARSAPNFKFDNHYLNRIYHDNENQDVVKKSMENLPNIDTDESIDMKNKKQQPDSANTEKLTESALIDSFLKFSEDTACLEACFTCISDDSTKKRSINDCGPTCECANSCSRMSMKKINQIYGQAASGRGDKDCLLKTYYQIMDIGVQSLH